MSILAEILAAKVREVAEARARRPLAELEHACGHAPPTRSLSGALRRRPGQPVRVIAEIKRASPSAGPIRPGADPAEIGSAYERAGASAISVLTDESFFDGRLAFLDAVRAVTSVPLLRKDFLIDAYQVYEARAAGADAVLLIAAALDQARLVELMVEARSLDLDVLVEVHNQDEAVRAAMAGADIIGVNHRDLATFTMDMSLTARIAPLVPTGAILVGESGIRQAGDVRALGAAGAHAVLVGEHLMRQPVPADSLAELVGVVPEVVL